MNLSGELPTELGNLSNSGVTCTIWDNNLTLADHYENGVLGRYWWLW